MNLKLYVIYVNKTIKAILLIKIFFCINCKKNLCPLYNSSHDRNHCIIRYAQKNFICLEQEENYSSFCKTCQKNLCIACENDHSQNDIISLGKIFPDIKELNKRMDDLKENINKVKDEIKKIIDLFKIFMENINIYYNIINDIYNSFNIKKKL